MPKEHDLKGQTTAYLFRALIFATTEKILFIYISYGYFSIKRRESFNGVQTKVNFLT
jgi:hypothetical protein